MLHLRLCHERLFGSVPEVDIGTVYRLQFVGVDRFVTVQDRLAATEWKDFAALVKQHVKVM